MGKADLQRFDHIPHGWLDVQGFANRCGLLASIVISALSRDTIPHRHIAMAPHGRAQQRGPGYVKILNFNAYAYEYILKMRPEFWPKDFVENREKLYKPILKNGELVAPVMPEDVGTPAGKKPKALPAVAPAHVTTPPNPEDPVPMVDLSSARLRHEQLKVRKLEAELAQLANKTVNIEDAKAANTACALEVRQALQGARRRMVPLLLGVKTSREMDAIIEAEIHTALEPLARMEQ